MSVWVVVGGQFGSEGKGKVSAIITLQEQIDICTRCGGPNSGHSFVNNDGQLVLLRQVPTGYIRKPTRLLIPAGALIDLALLQSEIRDLRLDPARVGVDRNAMIITPADCERERYLCLSERLSSTLCGVGSALARRVLRSPDVQLAAEAARTQTWLRPLITDVCGEVNAAASHGKKILVEGTQGSGLSLYHSDNYPKATSRDTNAAAFISEIGLSPRLVSEVVLVFRTFPIRVAGPQAGPLLDEISWEQLQAESGSPFALHEYTTVTRKLRRVGRFDWAGAHRAIQINRPTRIALNFLDYIDYANRGVERRPDFTSRTKEFLGQLESQFELPLHYLGVGPRLENSVSPGGATNTETAA